MSRWADTVTSHPIHETIEQSKKWITEGNALSEDSESETESRRLLKILNIVEKSIEEADSEVLAKSHLDGVNNHLKHQNFWQQLSAYSTSGATSALQNANNHIDGQLPTIAVLSEAGTKLKSARADLLEEQFDQFVEKISIQLEKFGSETESFREDLGDAKGKLKALEQTLDSLKDSVSGKLNDWETQFTNKSNERAELFSKSQIERENDYQSWRDTLENEAEIQIEEIRTSLESSVANIIKDIEAKHESIKTIHGLVARDGVAGGYKAIADSEKDSAWNWRVISIVFIVATVGWLFFTYQQSPSDSGSLPDLWQILKASSLSAVLLFGAVYSQRQSKVHRDAEQKMRWFALEVEALDPFISGLETSEQQSIKAKMAERLFAQERQAPPHKDVTPSSILLPFDKILELFKQMQK